MKKVLFVKAYSLKRVTIQVGARADMEAAAEEGRPASAEAEGDEMSGGHEATLSVASNERDRKSTDSADKNPHVGAHEKV
jgi:hypothetical protein